MDITACQLFGQYFTGEPTHLAFAPGRIEFIGNHTDYNGGLVMGAAVDKGITVAVRLRDDSLIKIVSDMGNLTESSLGNFKPVLGDASWTNYPVGVTKVMNEAGMHCPKGYDMAITSTLPSGAGMSSSAALELATAHALAALYTFETDTYGFARIGRKAENEFVGVPCGIMDQGVCAFGRMDHLVKIDCATEDFSTIPMPEGTNFWIFDSKKKHSLIDSAYAERFKECQNALVQLRAYYPKASTLSEISLEQLKASKDRIDPVLYRRATHVISENGRVCAVESALANKDLQAVGEVLNASHLSSRENFDNSIEELDTLVESLKLRSQVYGARLTGGGFGGAVMAMTDTIFSQRHADIITADFEAKYGYKPTIFRTQSGDGARLIT